MKGEEIPTLEKPGVAEDGMISADWIRSLTDLAPCKNGGVYLESEATLFLEDWESTHKTDCKRFWVLRFWRSGERWLAAVSVQENGRHNGTLYLDDVATRGDVLRVFACLGIKLKREPRA